MADDQPWGGGEQTWSKSSSWQDWKGWDTDWVGQRTAAGDSPAVGILIEWQNKGFNSFGWIHPLHGVSGAEGRHGGDVYVHCNDIQEPRLGSIVTFMAYQDQQGLGAQECRPRSVIRFVVPDSSADLVKLPSKEAIPAPSHLKSSVFYPEMEEKGVTLRKYLWEGSRRVFELWGNPQDVVAAAEQLALLEHPEAEVLLSPQMARRQDPDSLRLVSAEELPHLPAKCRLATSLRAGSSASPRQRLTDLFDVL
eukprot:CAMPEP_0197671494 /NCGR_PEP_ID=MMETSP1338-20131121/76802_1 /TAXON_ID=43686 ORGANISM="Pelagodinium beii, Strain RCC1491" /NCGR_SAMPLE_ID=MMETSP1338 /ASSEMBLY_ACC=CAM_ASM_000754 /LENGTH=250 /DNA_ID=CAMNT_0043251411 /DNA_START=60 /DNA_END=812 /DNA_ORIENTATION=-